MSDFIPKIQRSDSLTIPAASPNLYEILQTDCLSDKLPFEHCQEPYPKGRGLEWWY